MAELKVVGMDPSLRHWGMCKGTFNTETQKLNLPESKLIVTEPLKDKRAQNIRDMETAETLMREVYSFAKGADVVILECPVGSQSAAAMKGYAICVAIIACLKCAGLTVIVTTPMQGKAVVTGVSDSKENSALNVTKKEVINWVLEHHEEVPLPRYKRHEEMLINMGEAEHIADSVISIYAGLSKIEEALKS